MPRYVDPKGSSNLSFSWRDYRSELASVGRGLVNPCLLLRRLRSRAFHRVTLEEKMSQNNAESTGELKRTLTGLDLLMFGVGERMLQPDLKLQWPVNCCSIAATSCMEGELLIIISRHQRAAPEA